MTLFLSGNIEMPLNFPHRPVPPADGRGADLEVEGRRAGAPGARRTVQEGRRLRGRGGGERWPSIRST